MDTRIAYHNSCSPFLWFFNFDTYFSLSVVWRPSCWSFETRKIPVLEWLAVKLENAVHSVGLCPDWNCCAPDASSQEHPSLQNRTTSRGVTRANHHGQHSRQATNQFRGPFHRLANNNSSTGMTNTNTTASQGHQPVNKNGSSSKPAKQEQPAPVRDVDDPVQSSRSEWVWNDEEYETWAVCLYVCFPVSCNTGFHCRTSQSDFSFPPNVDGKNHAIPPTQLSFGRTSEMVWNPVQYLNLCQFNVNILFVRDSIDPSHDSNRFVNSFSHGQTLSNLWIVSHMKLEWFPKREKKRGRKKKERKKSNSFQSFASNKEIKKIGSVNKKIWTQRCKIWIGGEQVYCGPSLSPIHLQSLFTCHLLSLSSMQKHSIITSVSSYSCCGVTPCGVAIDNIPEKTFDVKRIYYIHVPHHMKENKRSIDLHLNEIV